MSTKPHQKGTGKPASTLEWLNGQVEAYLIKNPHVSPEGFGWASIRDSSLVGRLRAGKDVTTRKLDALVRYMSNPNQQKDKHHGKESRKETVKKGK
jgi:hypothetical protein